MDESLGRGRRQLQDRDGGGPDKADDGVGDCAPLGHQIEHSGAEVPVTAGEGGKHRVQEVGNLKKCFCVVGMVSQAQMTGLQKGGDKMSTRQGEAADIAKLLGSDLGLQGQGEAEEKDTAEFIKSDLGLEGIIQFAE